MPRPSTAIVRLPAIERVVRLTATRSLEALFVLREAFELDLADGRKRLRGRARRELEDTATAYLTMIDQVLFEHGVVRLTDETNADAIERFQRDQTKRGIRALRAVDAILDDQAKQK